MMDKEWEECKRTFAKEKLQRKMTFALRYLLHIRYICRSVPYSPLMLRYKSASRENARTPNVRVSTHSSCPQGL